MDGKLAAIFKRDKVLNEEEYLYVGEAWKKVFFSGGNAEDQWPYTKLLGQWEDLQEEEQ